VFLPRTWWRAGRGETRDDPSARGRKGCNAVAGWTARAKGLIVTMQLSGIGHEIDRLPFDRIASLAALTSTARRLDFPRRRKHRDAEIRLQPRSAALAGHGSIRQATSPSSRSAMHPLFRKIDYIPILPARPELSRDPPFIPAETPRRRQGGGEIRIREQREREREREREKEGEKENNWKEAVDSEVVEFA